jgi:hypothetical protein
MVIPALQKAIIGMTNNPAFVFFRNELFHQVEHSTLKIIDALKYHAHKLSQPKKPVNLAKKPLCYGMP